MMSAVLGRPLKGFAGEGFPVLSALRCRMRLLNFPPCTLLDSSGRVYNSHCWAWFRLVVPTFGYACCCNTRNTGLQICGYRSAAAQAFDLDPKLAKSQRTCRPLLRLRAWPPSCCQVQAAKRSSTVATCLNTGASSAGGALGKPASSSAFGGQEKPSKPAASGGSHACA